MWHAFADTRGLRHPFVRPNHLAAPSRRRAPWDVPPPWAKVSGSQTDLLTPWYDGRAEIIPFRYLPVLLGGKGTLQVGAVALYSCRVPPSRWHVSTARAWQRLASLSIRELPNCPSQESICTSLQCGCRLQSLELLRVSDAGGSRRSYRNGRV
jgi:hypothetical protein